MKSKIMLEESLNNSKRRFGSTTDYYPVEVVDINGIKRNALFTENQIDVAIKRANRNPEDLSENKTFWSWLTG